MTGPSLPDSAPAAESDRFQALGEDLRRMADWLDSTEWLRSPEMAAPETAVALELCDGLVQNVRTMLNAGDELTRIATVVRAIEPVGDVFPFEDPETPEEGDPMVGRSEALQLLRFGLRDDWAGVSELLLRTPHATAAAVHLVAIAATALIMSPPADPAGYVEDLFLAEVDGRPGGEAR